MMRTARVILMGFAIIVFGTLLVTLALIRVASPVSLTVRSVSTNRWSDAVAGRMGAREYLCAIVAFTNTSGHPVSYLARYKDRYPEFRLLCQTPGGWTEPQTGLGEASEREWFKLAPAQGFTFRAVLETRASCKVVLDYEVVQTDSPFQWLWGSLLPGLSRSNEWKVVITGPINLGSTLSMAKTNKASNRPSEWVTALQAAAEDGDPDAQFKLAGLCYRGDGVERNVPEAVGWYEKAAEKGHAEAAYNLGTIYEYGLGVKSNRTKATEWYLRAGDVRLRPSAHTRQSDEP